MSAADVFRPIGPVSPAVPLRVPRSGGSEVESLLAESNRKARQWSLDSLVESLPGVDIAALAQTADGATAALGHWAGPWSIEEGIDADAVFEAAVALAASGAAELARLVDGDEHHDLLAVDARRSVTDIGDALDQGWTLEVGPGAIAHNGLPFLIDDLGRAFGAPVTATLEVATTSSRGASPAVRPADHLVIQLVGSQTRFVRRPVQLSPHPGLPDSYALAVGPEVDCPTGAALHLPRGWYAMRLGREERSLAIDVAIRRPTVIDVLHELADLAVARPRLRADVPFDAEQPHASYAGSVMADPNLWTSEFGGLVDWPGFDQGLAAWRARMPVSRFGAPVGAAIGNRLPGGVVLGPADADQVVVAGGGVVASVPPTAIADLVRVLDTASRPAEDPTDPMLTALRQHGWVTGPP